MLGAAARGPAGVAASPPSARRAVRPLVRAEGEAQTLCVNPDCPQKRWARICHFASRGAMDIDGLGEQQVALFLELGLLEDVADIYSLDIDAIRRAARATARRRSPTCSGPSTRRSPDPWPTCCSGSTSCTWAAAGAEALSAGPGQPGRRHGRLRRRPRTGWTAWGRSSPSPSTPSSRIPANRELVGPPGGRGGQHAGPGAVGPAPDPGRSQRGGDRHARRPQPGGGGGRHQGPRRQVARAASPRRPSPWWWARSPERPN